MIEKLILGTVKFGDPKYGTSSHKHHLHPHELLDFAFAEGIRELDTSPRYGASEELIGSWHRQKNKRFSVSTKIDNLIPGPRASDDVLRSVERSLERTKVERFKTVYLHQNELSVISSPYVLDGMRKILEKNLAESVGTSIYTQEEFDFTLNEQTYSTIQTPLNLCDISFLAGPMPRKRIVARSIYLQGLLLNPEKIHSSIKDAEEMFSYVDAIRDSLASQHLLLSQGAMSFISHLEHVDSMIVGTLSMENLKEAIQGMKIQLPKDLNNTIFNKAIVRKSWSNPRSWKRIHA